MKRKRKWQARFRNSIGGIIFLGARRRGRGRWLRAEQIPVEVREYLAISRSKGAAANWYQRDYKSVHAIHEACKPDSWFRRSHLSVNFTVEEPVSRRPDRPLRRLVQQLSRQLFGQTLHGIYRQVYEHTDCGPVMGALVDDDWVYCDELRKFDDVPIREVAGRVFALGVAGYVEGWDGELDMVVTKETGGRMPSLQDFWRSVESADEEAAE